METTTITTGDPTRVPLAFDASAEIDAGIKIADEVCDSVLTRRLLR